MNLERSTEFGFGSSVNAGHRSVAPCVDANIRTAELIADSTCAKKGTRFNADVNGGNTALYRAKVAAISGSRPPAIPLLLKCTQNWPELAPFLRLASLMIVFQAIFDATNNSFIGQDLMQYTASTQIMMAVLRVINPTDAMLPRGHSGRSRHARSSGPTTDSARTELRALLGYGLPLYLAAILGVFLTQYQNIVLAET